MESFLETIESSCDAVLQLSPSNQASSSYPSAPFTRAILNPNNVEVFHFIRDADEVEASLFTYAPVAREATSEAVSALSTPRSGTVDDARVLLLAARKILDTYNPGPRARKHVDSLLAKHHELASSIESLEKTISENETALSQAVASTNASLFPSSDAARQDGGHSDMEAQMRREEMEILALEAMMGELQDRRDEIAQMQTRSSRSQRSLSLSAPTSVPSQDVGGADVAMQEDQDESMDLGGDEDSTIKMDDVDATAAPLLTEEDVEDVADMEEPVEVGRLDRTDDKEEVKRNEEEMEKDMEEEKEEEEEKGEEKEEKEEEDIPESTHELDIITDLIWTTFGDSLRTIAPERVGGDLWETLQILAALSTPPPPPHDPDMSLSSYTSGATYASTASSSSFATAGGGPPPHAQTMVAAHILSIFLRLPSPHTLPFPEIKARAGGWWERKVEEVGGRRSVRLENVVGADEGGEQLATKATYSLVAKKLLKIERNAGKASVRFALD